MNKTAYIVCEGASEYAYIQSVNRILKAGNVNINIIPKSVDTGHYKNVVKKYKEIRNSNKKTDIKIWVDKDIYKRNDKNNGNYYGNKQKNIPDFLFSIYNFEDFLVLHLEDNIVQQWINILTEKKHFNNPLKSESYLPLIKQHINIFHNYDKKEIPFDLTLEKIKLAYKHHKDPNIPIKCYFLDFLSEYIDLEDRL